MQVSAVVPPDADLERVWTALRARAEERRLGLQATLAVSPAALPMVRRLLAAQVLEESPGERPELLVSFAGTQHAVAELLRLGTRVEVLAPADLRAALRDAARELVDLYQAEA
jgi:predicted DNA-binding transcriptional regulator YafY